jgi:hypothetical protein
VLEIDGELRVWPRHRDGERRRTWYEQRFLPTLRALAELDVDECSSHTASRCCATAPARWRRAWHGRRGAGRRSIDHGRAVEIRWGQVGDDVASLWLRFQDGKEQQLAIEHGFYLYPVPSTQSRRRAAACVPDRLSCERANAQQASPRRVRGKLTAPQTVSLHRGI